MKYSTNVALWIHYNDQMQKLDLRWRMLMKGSETNLDTSVGFPWKKECLGLISEVSELSQWRQSIWNLSSVCCD